METTALSRLFARSSSRAMAPEPSVAGPASRPTIARTLAWLVALASLGLVACGDDDADPIDQGPADASGSMDAGGDMNAGEDMDGDDMPDGGGDEEPDYFVVCGLTFSPEGPSGYAAVVPSIDAGVTVDLETALPIPGLGACFGADGFLFVPQGEAPEIEKFTVTSSGDFESLGVVSFMGVGVPAIDFRNLVVVSETVAIYPDAVTQRLVVWNPDTLAITGTISLEAVAAEAPDGRPDVSFGRPVVRPDGTVVVVGSYGDGEGPSAPFFAAFVDLAGETVTSVAVATGCGNGGAVGYPDGSVYFANNSFAASSGRLGLPGSFAPCLRRIAPGETRFDEGYELDLAAVTGAAASADLVPGPGTSAFTLGYDEEVVPVTEMTSLRVLQNTPAWRLYRIEDIASPAEPAPVQVATPPGAGFLVPYDVGEDRVLLGSLAADLSGTAIIDVTDPASPETLLSAPSILVSVVPQTE